VLLSKFAQESAMELTSEYVGEFSLPYEVEPSWRRTMNYAAGVGDANALYFDDERPEGIIAHPMMAVALTWDISSDFQRYWPSETFPYDVLAQQVHYTETLIWHRMIRPGERLRIQGELAGIMPHRAGVVMTACYRAVDTRGEPVFTEYVGGMLREVKCVDKGAILEHVPAIPRSPRVDAPVWDTVLPIDPLAAHVYDGCADIAFPIHTSAAFAHAVGLPSTILHGTATLAMALRELVNRELGGDVTRVTQLDAMFTGMVLLDTNITIRLIETNRKDGPLHLAFEVLNADGQRAIRNGRLIAAG
jgi:acyl dehydratase